MPRIKIKARFACCSLFHNDVQILEISYLVMVKIEKVNIAVTYSTSSLDSLSRHFSTRIILIDQVSLKEMKIRRSFCYLVSQPG